MIWYIKSGKGNQMKRILVVVICSMIVITALVAAGCGKQETEVTPASTPTPAPTATATPEPTPTPTPEPASVKLMDIPEAESANYPLPEFYTAVDTAADVMLPINPGFTIYSFVDVNGTMQYRAFGQKIDPASGTVLEQGWYAVGIKDEPLTAESIKQLAAGERIVAVVKEANSTEEVPAGSVADTYIIGDTAKPFDEALLEQYDVVRKVIDFDALNAVPVDTAAEEATAEEPELPEETEAPAQDKLASGNKGSGSSGGSASDGGSSDSDSSSESGSGSESSDEPRDLEEEVFGEDGDEITGYYDHEVDRGDGWIDYVDKDGNPAWTVVG